MKLPAVRIAMRQHCSNGSALLPFKRTSTLVLLQLVYRVNMEKETLADEMAY